MDGNGRWAKAHGMPRTEGHRAGEASLMDVLYGAMQLGIPTVSAYAFSTENWRRSPEEVRFLMGFNKDVIRRRRDRLQKLADDVMLVHLRFPAGIRVKFKAGQHLNLILDNGERRDFSMANPPRESDGAQLHIRHVPGGAFTTYVFEKLKRGDRLKLEIPFGDFTLRESDKPILFVAGSTGFAPIQSIIEDMFIKGIRRDMTLYWGARHARRALLRAAGRNGRRRIRISNMCR